MSRTAPRAARALALAASFLWLSCDRPAPDQELYRRAHDASVTRNETGAKELYQQLLRQHPGSRFSPDAHLALAEMLFNDGDFDAALLEYGQVLGYPEGKSWGYALYKQGWCHMNQSHPRQALEIFERVVALEHDDKIPADRRRDLVDVARRDLVKAYAQLDEGPGPIGATGKAGKASAPERAADYFGRWGGSATTPLLELLAERYFEQEQLPESQGIYRDLIAGHVDSPRLCAWQNSLVRIAMVIGSAKEQLAEVQHLGAVLARVEDTGTLSPPDREACRTHLRDTLKEMTLASHKKGQKDNAFELYELADPLYRQYLTRFRDEQDVYSMTFFHGDVLWTLGRWEEAAQEYRRVMEMNPQGKFLNEAAYAYVLSTKNALKLDDEPAVAPGGPEGKPVPLSPAEQQMMAAFDAYIDHVHDGLELLKIEYRRARTHYEHRDYQTAAREFRAMVERHGNEDNELIGYAIDLELDCLNILGRTAELCARVRALQAGPAAARDKADKEHLRPVADRCKSFVP